MVLNSNICETESTRLSRKLKETLLNTEQLCVPQRSTNLKHAFPFLLNIMYSYRNKIHNQQFDRVPGSYSMLAR